MDVKTHLLQMSEAHGPSGYEAPVRELIRQAWQPLVDSFDVGKLGSLIGLKKGSGSAPRPTIMLCAHMDENGLIVRQIEDGFLRISRLGGPDVRLYPGLPVMVYGRRALPGVVGLPPPYAVPIEKKPNYPVYGDLFIDLGLPTAEVAELVSVGDVITMDTQVIALQGDRLAGKAMDDRACVAAVTACLDGLSSRKHSWDVLAVASVQEEVGSWGAQTEAFHLSPDLAIALDVTFADQPGMDGNTYPLGDGPVIGLGGNLHPALHAALHAAADRIEMKLADEPFAADTGTDAWPIQISRNGIPTALLQVPLRNMHSSVETISVADIERTGRLMAEFIVGLDADFLTKMVWDS